MTHNPSSAQPGETIHISIPQLSENVVIVPGSVSLLFNLSITGNDKNRFINNLGRNLVKELKVSYAGQTASIFQHWNLFKTYEDLFIATDLRDSGLLKYGISSEAIRKSRASASDKPSSPEMIATIHGTKYRIMLDHPILNDHGVFYPRGLRNSLDFQLKLAGVNDVVVFPDTTKPPGFTLSNLE